MPPNSYGDKGLLEWTNETAPLPDVKEDSDEMPLFG